MTLWLVGFTLIDAVSAISFWNLLILSSWILVSRFTEIACISNQNKSFQFYREKRSFPWPLVTYSICLQLNNAGAGATTNPGLLRKQLPGTHRKPRSWCQSSGGFIRRQLVGMKTFAEWKTLTVCWMRRTSCWSLRLEFNMPHHEFPYKTFEWKSIVIWTLAIFLKL